MKKIISILTIGLLLASCDNTDVAPVVSPSDYPTASFELADPSQQGTTIPDDMGGTIAVNASLSKPSAFATAIGAEQTGGTAVMDEDYEIVSGKIPAYETASNAPLMINVLTNLFPQPDRTAEIQVGVAPGTDGENFDLMYNPATSPINVSFTIKNVNSTEALTVGLKWSEDEAVDIDMVLLNSNGEELAIQATGDYPEIKEFIANAAPDGTYYISIQPYEVITPQWGFTFGISEPNGDVTTFTGIFDGDNLGAYTADMSPSLGEVYRLVKIVKNGTNYTLTQLP